MITGLRLNLRILWLCALAFLLAGSLPAQKIARELAGNDHAASGNTLRMVLQVLHDDSGALKARIYSIDQGPTGDWADSVSLQDSTVKFVVGTIELSYEGNLSSNGNTLTGTWIQGDRTPFIFRKATKETAWAFLPIRRHTRCSSLRRAWSQARGARLGRHWPASCLFAGLGDTAHVYDHFAPQFTGKYHVYGVALTASASPLPTPNSENYSSAVSATMFLPSWPPSILQKPVLVGHSIAGEELSSR